MKIIPLPGASAAAPRGHTRAGVARPRLGAWPFMVALGIVLAGCSFMKPAKTTERHFVLTPLPAGGPAPAESKSRPVGVRKVKLPAYLFNTSLAVRRETHEIEYLRSVLWAERLDSGIQRVLAANLARLLPTDQVRLSDWRSEDVSAEVNVMFEQFDVDASGQGVLVAWWRVVAPGGEKTLKAAECRLTRSGASPDSDPAGAVATLSGMLADLSRAVGQAILEAVPTTPPAP